MESFLSRNLKDVDVEIQDLEREAQDLHILPNFEDVSDFVIVENLEQDLDEEIKDLESKDQESYVFRNSEDFKDASDFVIVDLKGDLSKVLERNLEANQNLNDGVCDLERNSKDQDLKGQVQDLEVERKESIQTLKEKDLNLEPDVQGEQKISELNLGHRQHLDRDSKVAVSIAEDQSFVSLENQLENPILEDSIKVQDLNKEVTLFVKDLVPDLFTRHPLFVRNIHPQSWEAPESSQFTDDVGKFVMLTWHYIHKDLNKMFQEQYLDFLRGTEAFKTVRYYCSVIREMEGCASALHAVILISAVLLEWIAFLYRITRMSISYCASFYLYYWHYMFDILAKDEFYNIGGWQGLNLLARENVSDYDEIAHEFFASYNSI